MKFIRLFVLCLLFAPWPAAAFAAGGERDPLAYGIFRNGEEIGSSRVTFKRDGDRLVVETVVKIVVKVAFVPVYRQNELKREYWRNGVMVEYTADLEENGQKSTVRARDESGTLVAEGPAGRAQAPLGLIPSTYWNAETVRQTRLLDSTTGAVINVRVAPAGTEPVETGKGKVQGRRYRMTGDLVRELWYDDSGALVALRFKESGGSLIEYRRK